jgi:hypothetical protein
MGITRRFGSLDLLPVFLYSSECWDNSLRRTPAGMYLAKCPFLGVAITPRRHRTPTPAAKLSRSQNYRPCKVQAGPRGQTSHHKR